MKDKIYVVENLASPYIHVWNRILSIDPGTSMGYCWWNKHMDKPIEYGLLDCHHMGFGEKMNKVYAFIDKVLQEHPATLIVCEKPHAGKFMSAVMTLFGMVTAITLASIRNRCPVYVVSPTSVKLHWTGDGRAKKDAMLKQTQIGDLAPDVSDHNVSDAVAIGHFFIHRLLNKVSRL